METKISGKYNRFVKMAIKLAETVKFNHRHGAIVTRGGKVIGKGKNCYDRCTHAETCAIDDNWASEMQGATIVIIRLRKGKKLGMSRPCDNCMAKIRSVGIKRIVYSTNSLEFPLAIEKVI